MKQQGLYHPDYEHDACGVGLLVNIRGTKSHAIVEKGLQVLEHMVHRGAEGADPKTGDGAGIMVQIPHEFILLQGIPVPEKGRYGTGLVFLPKEENEQKTVLETIKQVVTDEHLTLLAIRDVPVNSEILGTGSRATEPAIKQLFVTGNDAGIPLERRLYVLRKKIENKIATVPLTRPGTFYMVSLSSKNIVYKGMFSTMQLRYYFPDLINPYFTSGMALVHSRFSTNTFPTWSLAQPFRLLGHNGEINTIRGNRLWSEARESVLDPVALGKMSDLVPIVQPGMSDSASLDNVLEFFVMSGMSLPHALSMLIPESFNDKNPITPELKAFYEYHSILMEPWDGPATLLFSDGQYAGGMLDRNGLRPARYLITKNDMMVVASETGVLAFDGSEIKEHGRLQPGKMLLVDMEKGEIYSDALLKEELAKARPYAEWLSQNRIKLEQVSSGRKVKYEVDQYARLLRVFGYHQEDIERILIPMITDCKEPIASMGNDTPLAVFSRQPQRLFNYFRQQFAQVTNPPIDPLREELVMSLSSYIGVINHNLLEASPELCKMVELKSPVLTNRDVDLLCNLRYKGFRTKKLSILFHIQEGPEGMEKALDKLCREAENAVDEDYNYIILTDRDVDSAYAPLPSLLAVSAVHHSLIAKRKRVQTALIIETAEAREIMHFALLLGYGASAVNPYMAFAVVHDLVSKKEIQLDYHTAEKNYIKAVDKGLLKVISKMGISTIASYRGAELFEAIGLSSHLLDRYFQGTVSKMEGIGLEELYADALADHKEGFTLEVDESDRLRNTGLYSYRKSGEYHAWNPQTIATLQQATRLESYRKFKEYTALVDDKPDPVFLRDCLSYKKNPIDISEVEPVEAITRRFVTGAMSYGSISKEAHEALAIAMNQLGGQSNTGEGGEDAFRFTPREDGTSARSAIKQVASGRFGVTAEYLVNADEIQIKIAQGAKPGEGGQLPGFKVDRVIARTRHSIPGISLISPPPHHDIYSIEDLAQLIFDLKNVNPQACVSVKLVSESGVGTIAAGVAKAKADLIVISGAEGGTGASPASSIRHAGLPSEIGLAETQQTLVINNLRGQVKLQVDGQLKTGRDVIIQALLGAEEFGFATSALIVLGCVMMRKCHENTCPVGVATQNEELRKRFKGRSQYLVTFFTYLAREVREHLAEMGYRKLDDIIGRSDLLEYTPRVNTPKAKKIDFSRLLYRPAEAGTNAVRKITDQDHKIDTVVDRMLVKAAQPALVRSMPVELHSAIYNTDRAVGAMLSGEIARRYGNDGLPEDTVRCTFTGSAGQSFGAFLAHGVTFRLEGDANDYLGKGLSGGKIILAPPQGATFAPEENVIAGNTLLYGATAGEVYINGQVGERFCVRNSGAIAVVEGVGDHCCEYMTGGRTVVLGTVGRNFAAGMSGGIAYVWNKSGNFDFFCNMEMVELSLIEDVTDYRELQQLVGAHYSHTNSPLAKEMLGDWSHYVTQFIKVMPIEYKKVLHDEKAAALQRKIAEVQRDY
ncbi:glutamate synthase large subunit [Parabacteroides pacaensis]|uniref:glutamate synthase large subunit n=1 Tax=Parabacteroides pacaensis TaxID=2086575 RepID=UPI000D0E5658|nr:glutamate synthase large subunit [Parabacteroides pacaensis]